MGHFPLSTTRQPIIASLGDIVSHLCSQGIQAELWLNGSLLTEKIDPQDADCVLCLHSDFLDNCSTSQMAIITWFSSNLRNSHRCDTYVFVEYPASDPRFRCGEDARRYWERQFGFSRGNQAKGIAVVKLPLT